MPPELTTACGSVPTLTLLACRGCCCGQDDRADQRLDALTDAASAAPGGRWRVTNCLGPCERKDVVAIRHRRSGTRGPRLATTWLAGLGETCDDAVLGGVVRWVAAGAPLPVPRDVAAIAFDPVAGDVTPDHEITPSVRDIPSQHTPPDRQEETPCTTT